MDAWSACAPNSSHYSVTVDDLNIRERCEAKKPISAADATVAVASNVNATGDRFIVPGETAVVPVGRRLLRSS
jgi:hypothetical protein